jgi:hypothetical protein
MKKYLPLFLLINTLIASEMSIASPIKLETYEVKVSNENGKIISEIVSTLGGLSLLSLGFKKSHLKELGSNLKGVGPLHFLGYIFSNDELKSHLKTIHQSSIKWKGFLEGLKPGFERELNSNELMDQIPAFATFVKVDANILIEEAKKGDWDRFVAVMVEKIDTK